MTYFGRIKTFDSEKGAGMIAPDKGGDALPFERKDLLEEAQDPGVNQRYGYETSEVNGRDRRAIDLQAQEGDVASVQQERTNVQQG